MRSPEYRRAGAGCKRPIHRFPDMSHVLFRCGYFHSGYLGYEAAEGIDWIWEQRISDLDLLGI